jgi:hypothetical protein
MKNDNEVIELKAEIKQLEAQVQWLMEQLKLARHRQFGASSEKTSSDQLSLFNEAEATADPTVTEPEIEQAIPRRRKQKGKREKDFSGLPTDQVVHELSENERICPACGGTCTPMKAQFRCCMKKAANRRRKAICGFTAPSKRQSALWCFSITSPADPVIALRIFCGALKVICTRMVTVDIVRSCPKK